ncbi:CRISPR-associated endonuclease Cas2 [Kiritimatiella glycovorans]|uniref:CRISPR-associated endoribonuclease Cas2 n=1 Tax=Kiritimatiella glycovorans TaxID=1307763 RepID=A0A0G3EFU7_9BACT|nr:CRISPR-associated endonuclease Cas2 [Kiritimatiella glycovorans]AKJ65238.1 CRISPR-associated endoribonuclease Cas2 [Kiritimatiella glycovorans]
MIALFDLPVVTKRQRQKATRFRILLLKDGFCMLQYSVYARYCASEDVAKVHRKRISSHLPDEGQIRILSLTDKQFGKMEVYCGKKREKTEPAPAQLEFL